MYACLVCSPVTSEAKNEMFRFALLLMVNISRRGVRVHGRASAKKKNDEKVEEEAISYFSLFHVTGGVVVRESDDDTE